MLGYSPEEILQLHLWDWDVQWTQDLLFEMHQDVNEKGDHFEPLHRCKDVTLSRKYGGIGLSLPIAKKLVELHGGSLCVRSEPEKGSHLYLIFLLGKVHNFRFQIEAVIFA